MQNPSENLAIKFQNVVKSYTRSHRQSAGLKHALLHLPSTIRKWKSTERFTALNRISFDIRKGETFGICGHNGSGKSTTLGLMAKVLRPNEGTVSICGRVSPLLELGAGFHPELSGKDNIHLNGVILGMTLKEVKRVFDQIVDFAEIHDFLDEPLRTYSSGMIMRLGFSVAVHTEPDILLVDEVLAVGDMGFQAKCLKKMESFRNSAVTIVFVTHQFDQIQTMCDRALLLDHGKIATIGPPNEVQDLYQELLEKEQSNSNQVPEGLK